ncbi:MAG: hypothetical protein ABJB55_02435 [Actinomycetota bacterium]
MSAQTEPHGEPYLSEWHRGMRAALLGALFGVVLALLGRRR